MTNGLQSQATSASLWQCFLALNRATINLEEAVGEQFVAFSACEDGAGPTSLPAIDVALSRESEQIEKALEEVTQLLAAGKDPSAWMPLGLLEVQRLASHCLPTLSATKRVARVAGCDRRSCG
jgi:hypothetical protein